MMHPTPDELGMYVDGELTDVRASEVAEHVRSCVTCRRDVESQRYILSEVAALPRTLELPGNDWGPLKARLVPSPRSGATRTPRLHVGGVRLTIYRIHVIAAAILGAISVSTTTVLMRRSRDAASVATARIDWPEPASPWAFVAGAPSQFDLVRLQHEIDVLLEEEKHTLRPETFAAVQRNLGVIDEAIREVGNALARDSASTELRAKLFRAFEQKAALLRQTAQAS